MDIKTLWETIKTIFSEMWPVIWPVLKITLTKHGKIALAAAVEIVKKVQEEMPTASGEEKIMAVLSRLTEVLALQGIAFGTEMLRFIIKMAYEAMVAAPEVIAEAKNMQIFIQAEKEEDFLPEWVK